MIAPSLALAVAAAGPPLADLVLRKEVEVAAAPAEVWAAWTTSAGAETFFAPRARIELEPGGAYEILFAPDARPGERGAEGLRVLAFVPREMLVFEWNAPPRWPEIRNGPRTWVVVRLEPAGDRHTRVSLQHAGWRQGGRWGEVYAYFEKAWEVVLERLQRRFASGPLDWAAEARR
jgi:uncharacterized protein YndB with AHSA1/START domain